MQHYSTETDARESVMLENSFTYGRIQDQYGRNRAKRPVYLFD